VVYSKIVGGNDTDLRRAESPLIFWVGCENFFRGACCETRGYLKIEWRIRSDEKIMGLYYHLK
jgi:hypothetical protein